MLWFSLLCHADDLTGSLECDPEDLDFGLNVNLSKEKKTGQGNGQKLCVPVTFYGSISACKYISWSRCCSLLHERKATWSKSLHGCSRFRFRYLRRPCLPCRIRRRGYHSSQWRHRLSPRWLRVVQLNALAIAVDSNTTSINITLSGCRFSCSEITPICYKIFLHKSSARLKAQVHHYIC